MASLLKLLIRVSNLLMLLFHRIKPCFERINHTFPEISCAILLGYRKLKDVSLSPGKKWWTYFVLLLYSKTPLPLPRPNQLLSFLSLNTLVIGTALIAGEKLSAGFKILSSEEL